MVIGLAKVVLYGIFASLCARYDLRPREFLFLLACVAAIDFLSFVM